MINPVKFKEDCKPKPNPKRKKKPVNPQLKMAMKINQRSLIIQGYLKNLSEQEIKDMVERELKTKVRIEYIYKVISEYRTETGDVQQTKGEKTREMIIHYLRMGVKQSVIARSLNVTRSYVSKVNKDWVILSYLIRGTINEGSIADVLGITVKEVLAIKGKYKSYIRDYS